MWEMAGPWRSLNSLWREWSLLGRCPQRIPPFLILISAVCVVFAPVDSILQPVVRSPVIQCVRPAPWEVIVRIPHRGSQGLVKLEPATVFLGPLGRFLVPSVLLDSVSAPPAPPYQTLCVPAVFPGLRIRRPATRQPAALASSAQAASIGSLPVLPRLIQCVPRVQLEATALAQLPTLLLYALGTIIALATQPQRPPALLALLEILSRQRATPRPTLFARRAELE